MNRKKLKDLIRPTIEGMGYELWGCEYIPQRKHALLRIYIDGPEGVTVGDCQAVSKQLGALFDVEDPTGSSYSLEVSSPGVERILFELEQFERYIGQQVSIKLYSPVEDRRNFTGELTGVMGLEAGVAGTTEVIIKVDEQEYKLMYSNIQRANLKVAL